MRLIAKHFLVFGLLAKGGGARPGYVRLLPYAIRQWRSFSLILLLTLGSSLVTAMQPWPMKVLIDFGLKKDTLPTPLHNCFDAVGLPATQSIIILVAALGSLSLFAISSAVDAGLTWGWAVAGQGMVFRLTADLFHRLQRLSLSFHRSRSVGDSLSRLTVDTWAIYGLASSVLIFPLQQAFLLVTVGVVAFRFDRQLALISLALAPLLGAASVVFGCRLKRRAQRARQTQSELASFVQQTLSAIPIVQSYGMERRNGERFREVSNGLVHWSQRGALINSCYGLVSGLINAAGMSFSGNL